MARDFLAIPATSVPSEQVFSIAGQILNKRRACLSENMMNAIMCCKAWLGVQEITSEELIAEEQLLAHLNEVATEGDLPLEIAGVEDDD